MLSQHISLIVLEYYSCAHEPPPFPFLDLDLFLSLLPRDDSEADPSSFSATGSTSYFSIPRCPGTDGIEKSDKMLWGGPESMGGWSSASCDSGVADGAGVDAG